MLGPIRHDVTKLRPARPRVADASWATRTAARALGLSLAALAFAVGSAAASTQIVASPGSIVQAVGSKVATVYTSVHDWNEVPTTTVPAGVLIHPAIVVTGNDGTPTGTVVAYFYSSSDCSSGKLAGYSRPLPANATIDDINLNRTSKVPTTLSLRINYLGDATYAAAWGPCRAVTFTKVDPSITLKIHDWNDQVVSTVPFTQDVHADVKVSGPSNLDQPAASIAVRAWHNATCDGVSYISKTVSPDASGEADWANEQGFSSPGFLSYRAGYTGDATYNATWSSCVTVEGLKATPSMTFVLHDAGHQVPGLEAALGDPIHVSAGITGQGGNPTGTLTIHVYTGKDCQVQTSQHSVPATASLDDGNFGKVLPDVPGYTSWKLEYSGDANYQALTSTCSSRHFLAPVTLTVAVHDASHGDLTSIVVGQKVHLDVTVSGDFGPVSAKIALEASKSGGCANGAAFAFASVVGGASDDASKTYTAQSVGTAWFEASYPGDGTTYGWSRSTCIAIDVKPAPATPAPGATATPSAEAPAGPTASPGATADPSAPVATDAPATVPTPAASQAPSATAAPADPSPAPAASDAVGAGAGPTTPAGGASSGGALPVLIGVGILAAVAGLAVWFIAGRRRRTELQRVGEPLTSA